MNIQLPYYASLLCTYSYHITLHYYEHTATILRFITMNIQLPYYASLLCTYSYHITLHYYVHTSTILRFITMYIHLPYYASLLCTYSYHIFLLHNTKILSAQFYTSPKPSSLYSIKLGPKIMWLPPYNFLLQPCCYL